jgi:hypothetical protein
MLIELARRMPATIVTTDLGLARVAEIQGIPILNLNDVANALKPALVPGETLTIRLIKPGEQAGQAVGYLDDGTMVVADAASHRIGDDAVVMVTSTLQTSAGRLIFTRLQDEDGLSDGSPGADQHQPRIENTAPPAPAALPAAAEPPAAPPKDEAGGQVAPRHDAGETPYAAPPEPSKHQGPFPPKPPMRRTNSARNPRR